MDEYESHVVRGWRGRLEDDTRVARSRVWNASSFIFHRIERDSSELLSQTIFGTERIERRYDLRELRLLSRRIKNAERPKEEREFALAYYRAWRLAKPREWHEQQNRKKRERRAVNIDDARRKARGYYAATRDERNLYYRKWRAARRALGLPAG